MRIGPGLPLLATTAPGVEAILAAECARHGLEVGRVERGAVTLAAGTDVIERANLHLRTASRVLLRIAEFSARTFPELERRARRMPWGLFLRPGDPLRFRVAVHKSRLYHQGAIAQRLGEAAVATVGAVVTERAADDREEDSGAAAQLVVVRVVRDRFTVSADSSGALLHRRGYRLATAKAPLRETLAAAMLFASGWNGRRPLADPFAGSGTIPIEAALLARRIPPGIRRRFAFQRWPSIEREPWNAIVSRAREQIRAHAPGLIAGYDRDAGAVADARANAERAGVADDATFEVRPVSALPAFELPGHLVTNPPYGLRIGDRRSLRNLYARLGAVAAQRCPGSTLTVLLASREHRHAIGLPLGDRFRTTSGGVPVWCASGVLGSQAEAASPP